MPRADCSLRLDSGEVLIQSPDILEYLEERYPAVPLLPAEPLLRARHRGVAALIACDVHPLHNVSVLNRLRGLGLEEPAILNWISHWIGEGLAAVEAQIGSSGFCFGDVGLADVYLLPQLYAARRFQVDLSPYPRLLRVEALAPRIRLSSRRAPRLSRIPRHRWPRETPGLSAPPGRFPRPQRARHFLRAAPDGVLARVTDNVRHVTRQGASHGRSV